MVRVDSRSSSDGGSIVDCNVDDGQSVAINQDQVKTSLLASSHGEGARDRDRDRDSDSDSDSGSDSATGRKSKGWLA